MSVKKANTHRDTLFPQSIYRLASYGNAWMRYLRIVLSIYTAEALREAIMPSWLYRAMDIKMYIIFQEVSSVSVYMNTLMM